MNEPYLLIVCGPTASGKGSLPNKVINYLNINDTYENILIDNLVENNPYFINGVNNIIQNYKQNGYNDNDIIELFLNPTDELLKELSEVYFIARDHTDCITGDLIEENTCSIINDSYLEESFNKGLNIVFETTGTYFPEWLFELFQEQIMKYNYHIIISYTVVDICKLLNRNIKRIQQDIINYLTNQSNKVPRLPDIRLKSYTNNLKKIINTFLYTNKFQNQLVCRISNYPNCIIRLIIFDNNSIKSKLVYDSYLQTPEIGDKYILNYNLHKAYICKDLPAEGTVKKLVTQYGSRKKYKKNNKNKSIKHKFNKIKNNIQIHN